jgi:uracil-DNA glycosylase
VVTLGRTALRAVDRIARPTPTLAEGKGKLHDWYGRKHLPLYHPGLLGRITRKVAQQIEDIRALGEWVRGSGGPWARPTLSGRAS